MADTKSPQRVKKRSKRPVYITLGLIVVIGIVIAALGAFAYTKLSSARDDLNRASTNASQLRAALIAGDQAKASSALQRMQTNVDSAQSSLDSSVLTLAEKAPVIGKNVKAVRTISSAVGSVAEEGLPPLVDIADKFNGKTFNPKDGKVDIAALAELTPSLMTSSRSIAVANKKIQSVDALSLLGQLQGPVEDAQDKIGDAASIASRATVASRVVPQMLSGKHTYLLIFQNNAEIRATGGLPGAYALLKVNDGNIELDQQSTGNSFKQLPEPVVPLTNEEHALFDTKLGTFFLDANFTPDFPRAAEIATAFLAQQKDTEVDGVLSLDPVTLSYLLKGLGPIALGDGTKLTTDNAVDVLLNNVYVNYPTPSDQDAFFAEATKQIFDKVIAGAGDPTAILKSLTKATRERRVSVWAKDPAVNAEIAKTPLAHDLPAGDAATPALGYYLNDSTGAKMQYYLKSTVTGSSTQCSDDGVQSYTTEMSLSSSAPADAASLPTSIQGPGFGAVPGSMLMNLYVYGPAGGAIESVSFDGEDTTAFSQQTHEGRPVAQITVQVNPGQTVKVGANIKSGPSQTGSTVVSSTPSIVPGPSVQTWKSSC